MARRLADAADRHRVVATATVRSVHILDVGPASSCICEVDDGTGQMAVVFLGRPEVPGVTKGTLLTLEGTARMDGGRLVVWNPRYRLEPLDADDA